MKFLFEVHIKPGYTAEQYAAAWIRVSHILQQAPGARGTRLHRMIGRPDRLLAVATWTSKSARDAMDRHRDPAVQSILKETARYCDIHILGEFEDAEWQVDPP